MKKKDEKPKDKEDLQTKLEELENQFKRSLADYQNLEKRVTEEKKEWAKSANRQLLLRLLPALDALILAQKHTKDEGISLSIQKFLDILESEGVKKIKTEGKDFDPKTMECVQTVQGEEGKIIEEIRPGYMLFDNVLRVAQVAVGKGLVN